jgi:hypothetical protein
VPEHPGTNGKGHQEYRTIGSAPNIRREVSVLALGAMLFGSRNLPAPRGPGRGRVRGLLPLVRRRPRRDGPAAAGPGGFERLLAVRNDVGLLSEQRDPDPGRQLGDAPQAFSHIALVETDRQVQGLTSNWKSNAYRDAR